MWVVQRPNRARIVALLAAAALLGLGIAAGRPLDTEDLTAVRIGVPSYGAAIQQVARTTVHEDSVAVPSGHSILLVHGQRAPRAFVLFHGVTAATRLANGWCAHGASVAVITLPDSLGLPHDVIDPRQPVKRLDVVYAVLDSLLRALD